jgi:ABC-2 type transport system ATP-binding protein
MTQTAGSGTALASTTAAVALTRLTKSFSSVPAVRELDLTVAPGEIVALLGPNGAGKSTTTEMILGLTKPDAGQVRVFGLNPVRAMHRGMVGAMLQGGALLQETSVRDLLELMHGLHRHPLPMAEVVERADIGSFLTTKTDKLSGGQAQRLRFALAILPDPDLLILDEPTVAMDVEIRRAFWASMQTFTERGRTVLFATHYLEEADQVADRIVVLAQGRIVANGSGAQIKSRVAGRTISVAAGRLTPPALSGLPGVVDAALVGSRLQLHSTNSDQTLRALLQKFPEVADIEIASANLEDAFLALTAQEQS